MKIDKPAQDIVDRERIREALERLLCSPSPLQSPPCQNCQMHMPSVCTPACDRAAMALSSEPEAHPLEPKTVPLVFELSASGIAQPCWSCEGHLDHEGKLWRIPQISFYLSEPVYGQLLLKYISRLKSQKRLAYAWHVVVTDYGPLDGVTYSLQPCLDMDGDPHLGKLQQDMLSLAKDFSATIKELAQDCINQL